MTTTPAPLSPRPLSPRPPSPGLAELTQPDRPDSDLLSAALVGTDRRPPAADPGSDPVRVLLTRAVRWRVSDQVAAGLERCLPLPTIPPAGQPGPPPAARELLAEMLRRPGALLVNLWFGEAAAHGSGLAAEHWTPVLDRARREPDLDRAGLAAALGPRGRWFARQNAAWQRVVRDFPATSDAPSGAAAAGSSGPVDIVDLDALRHDPGRLLALPGPWSEQTCTTAVDLVASGTLPTRDAAPVSVAIGVRLPLSSYRVVAQAIQAQTSSPEPAGPTTAFVGLSALEDVLWTRLLLARAFDPTARTPERRPPPPRRGAR